MEKLKLDEINIKIAQLIFGRSKLDMIIPEYSTNLMDAWKIVEYMVKQGREVGVSYVRNDFCTFSGWVADIGPANGFQHIESETAQTAPLAICLTALRTVGLEIEVDYTSAQQGNAADATSKVFSEVDCATLGQS